MGEPDLGKARDGEPASVAGRDDRRLSALDKLVMLLLMSLAGALGFLALNRPWVSDDFYNAVVLREHPGLWDYMSYWYTTWTGRFSASAFSWVAHQVQSGFGIAIWIGLLLLVVMTFAVARARLPHVTPGDLYALSLLSVAYWYGLPAIQETVFWASGASAYLLPAVATLIFIYQYRRWDAGGATESTDGPRGILRLIGMFLLGVCVGGFQEQVLVACVLLLVVLGVRTARARRPVQVPARLHAGALGLVLAGAVSLAAPGNGVRLDAVPDYGFWETVVGAAKFAVHLTVEWLPPLVPWLLCLLLLSVPVVLNRAGKTLGVPGPRARSDWWLWILLGLATISPLLVRPFFGAERTSVFIAVFLAVSALSMGSEGQERLLDRLPVRATTAALCLVLLLTTADVGLSAWQAYALTRGQRERAGIIARAKQDGVLDVVVPPITEDMPRRGVIWGDGSADKSFYGNQLMASYYGVGSVVVAPDPTSEAGIGQ